MTGLGPNDVNFQIFPLFEGPILIQPIFLRNLRTPIQRNTTYVVVPFSLTHERNLPMLLPTQASSYQFNQLPTTERQGGLVGSKTTSIQQVQEWVQQIIDAVKSVANLKTLGLSTSTRTRRDLSVCRVLSVFVFTKPLKKWAPSLNSIPLRSDKKTWLV